MLSERKDCNKHKRAQNICKDTLCESVYKRLSKGRNRKQNENGQQEFKRYLERGASRTVCSTCWSCQKFTHTHILWSSTRNGKPKKKFPRSLGSEKSVHMFSFKPELYERQTEISSLSKVGKNTLYTSSLYIFTDETAHVYNFSQNFYSRCVSFVLRESASSGFICVVFLLSRILLYWVCYS